MRNKITLSLVAALAIVAILIGAGSLPRAFAAGNQQTEPPTSVESAPMRTISVNGTGTVNLDPDMATINIGVHTENSDAQQAVADNNAQAQEVMDVLKNAGIAERDISTSNFSIYPRQDYDKDGNVISTTYVVDNSVQVKVRDLSTIGSVLDAVVSAGANSINGIQFSVEDSSAAYNDALEAAVMSARSRAEVLAEAAGVELGEVQSISSSVSGGPTPVYQDVRMSAESAAAAVPISPGQTQITVDVSVVYTIR
ncbi:MAG: SIMPL domain-containing protein [Anaerolineales bacterium]|jgi:uncharacterized protein YggE